MENSHEDLPPHESIHVSGGKDVEVLSGGFRVQKFSPTGFVCFQEISNSRSHGPRTPQPEAVASFMPISPANFGGNLSMDALEPSKNPWNNEGFYIYDFIIPRSVIRIETHYKVGPDK